MRANPHTTPYDRPGDLAVEVALLRARIAKPAGVDDREVAVAVRRAGVALPRSGCERRRVRLIRRVDVQQRGRLVLDVHLAAPATGVRIVLDVVHAAGMVSVRILMLQIVLVAFRRPIHLPEEPSVLRVAARVVRAAQAHRGFELEGGRTGRGNQMLLLLQHGEQHFWTDSAGFRRFADDRGSGFALRPLVRLAFAAGGLVLAIKRHDAQTLASRA